MTDQTQAIVLCIAAAVIVASVSLTKGRRRIGWRRGRQRRAYRVF